MNNLDKQYIDLLKTILEHGVDKKDRTGIEKEYGLLYKITVQR